MTTKTEKTDGKTSDETTVEPITVTVTIPGVIPFKGHGGKAYSWDVAATLEMKGQDFVNDFVAADLAQCLGVYMQRGVNQLTAKAIPDAGKRMTAIVEKQDTIAKAIQDGLYSDRTTDPVISEAKKLLISRVGIKPADAKDLSLRTELSITQAAETIGKFSAEQVKKLWADANTIAELKNVAA